MSVWTLTRLGLGVLEILVGIGAVAGGGVLAAAPNGTILKMPLSLLQGTPFRTFRIPGLLLCIVVGGSHVIAGWLALRQRRSASSFGMLAGGILTGWMTTQLVLIGYRHPIQTVYLVCGIAIFVIAATLRAAPPPMAASGRRT
jgi:hypothetical protein